MAWNVMQVELMPEDLRIDSMVGPGGFTREQALAEVQGLLDRLPALAETAAIWRRGAKDDTVHHALFCWTIYEYPDGADPRRAALEWLEGYAAIMRNAGLDVQGPKLPDPPTES